MPVWQQDAGATTRLSAPENSLSNSQEELTADFGMLQLSSAALTVAIAPVGTAVSSEDISMPSEESTHEDASLESSPSNDSTTNLPDQANEQEETTTPPREKRKYTCLNYPDRLLVALDVSSGVLTGMYLKLSIFSFTFV